MAYTAPTAADLKGRFPRFSAVDDAAIDSALTEAARMVDETWTEGDFAMARMLYACHVLTMDGLGTGAESEAASAGAAGFSRMKSGSLELERAGGAGASSSGLGSTTYGKRFLDLLKLNRGGARVTGGICQPVCGC